ncbi:DNA-3-methyladenine glycosylase family protein [Thermomonospora cellulosilytica]|uniref:3-methyladenine DNA glycosylase/8-oxoguanine DNA glycosylase n=1 Tax=Thermomonospora cellulosilytica TaxID=1411118 RepID=A0A7W3RCC0_9ACTN|nr:DNA-3-methyladenine glycosylase 2 family protein [Thermomonospora cellulosilytica]MBA9007922.1 3-methyladenine DNA glycosylase/8-oxoguanine DNA glycosylase [Thermomonospora cellulosilytica]
MTGGRTRVWRPPWPLDVAATLSPHRRGGHDPAYRVTPDGAVWRASFTPDGPGTLRVLARAGEVEATAWGPGADWLLDGLPELLGSADEPGGLRPVHPVVAECLARGEGMRIGRTRRVFEALVPAVLEQKVVSIEAWRAWGYLLRRFGEPAPGAPGMRVPPPPAVWARIPSWEWHRAGAEAVRARTVMNAARVAAQLERDPSERRLRSLPGIGVWTAAEIRQRAAGDPDAVSVGDYNLPGLVGWALAGRKVDDAGMLALLEPYAGHRYRVTRLLELSGRRPPRRGPRMSVRDYRSF